MSNAIYPVVRGLAWPVMKTSKESTIVQTAASGVTVRIPQYINPLWEWTLTYEYLKDNPNDVMSAFTPWTDYQTMQGFYLVRNGQADDFLFDDPADDTVGPRVWTKITWYQAGAVLIDPSGHQQTALVNGNSGAVAPTWNDSGGVTSDVGQSWQDGGAFPGLSAQPLALVNDGAGNYYSPLQRNFGGQFLEDITDLNTSVNPLRVWADGVLQNMTSPLNYVLSGPGLAIPGHSYEGLYLAWTAMPTAPVTAAFNFYFRVRFDMDALDFEEFLYQLWTIGGGSSKNGSGYLKLTSSREALA